MSIKILIITPYKLYKNQNEYSRDIRILNLHQKSIKKQKCDLNIHSILSDMSIDQSIQKEILNICKNNNAEYRNIPSTLIWNKALCLNAIIKNEWKSYDYICTVDADIIFRSDVFLKASDFLNTNNVILNQTFLIDKEKSNYLLNYLEEIDFSDFSSVLLNGKFLKICGNGGLQIFNSKWLYDVHGCDERYNLWGGPDNEIIKRAQKAQKKVIWLNKINQEILQCHLFHSTFSKNEKFAIDYKQTNNIPLYHKTQNIIVNQNSWGIEKNIIGPRSI